MELIICLIILNIFAARKKKHAGGSYPFARGQN